MLRTYTRLIVFAAGLLIGVQIPNFAEQYMQRVSAHLIEAEKNFSGFQLTANTYFGGDVDALIAHHAASADRVFRDEAKTIAEIYARVKMWREEWDVLQSNVAVRIVRILLHSNAQICGETWAAYTYEIPLTPPAMACGIILGVSGALIVEGLLFGLVGAAMRQRRTS